MRTGLAGTGSILIMFSAFCFVAVVWRQMTPEFKRPLPEVRHIPSWALDEFTVMMVTVSFAALIGIWL
jgi:putative membrane protein